MQKPHLERQILNNINYMWLLTLCPHDVFIYSAQDVDPENPASIVRTLCVAINSYCAQLLASKAELLSIYVVQYAR